jgi:hypothetical protein
MSSIQVFRLNGYDPYAEGRLEFYCKVQNDKKHVMCNFCLSDDGLYHYPKGAHILTKNEHETENIEYTGNGDLIPSHFQGFFPGQFQGLPSSH